MTNKKSILEQKDIDALEPDENGMKIFPEHGKVWALDHPEEDIVKTRFSHCHGEDFEPNRVEKAKRFLLKFLSMK